MLRSEVSAVRRDSRGLSLHHNMNALKPLNTATVGSFTAYRLYRLNGEFLLPLKNKMKSCFVHQGDSNRQYMITLIHKKAKVDHYIKLTQMFSGLRWLDG